MTTYTTLSAALSLLGRNGELTASTTPTLTEAATLHEWIAADVNAALAVGGITPPVTTPAALVSWLGKVEADGLASTVLKVRFQDLSGVNSEGAWSFYEKRYQDALTLIRAGQAATLAGAGCEPASYYTRNPDEDEDLGDLSDALPLTRRMEL